MDSFQPLVGAESDLPAVTRFKQIVARELEQHFAPSCIHTAKSLPNPCAALDARYAHLRFFNTELRELKSM